MPPRCGSWRCTHCLPFDSLPEPQHPYLFILFLSTESCDTGSATFGLKPSHQVAHWSSLLLSPHPWPWLYLLEEGSAWKVFDWSNLLKPFSRWKWIGAKQFATQFIHVWIINIHFAIYESQGHQTHFAKQLSTSLESKLSSSGAVARPVSPV